MPSPSVTTDWVRYRQGNCQLGVEYAVAVVSTARKLRDENVVGPRAGKLGLIRLLRNQTSPYPKKIPSHSYSPAVYRYAETLISRCTPRLLGPSQRAVAVVLRYENVVERRTGTGQLGLIGLS